MAGTSIALILLLGYWMRRTGSLSPAPDLGKSIASPLEAGELAKEIPSIPASAIVSPAWKKLPGQHYWPGIRQPPTQSVKEAELEDDAGVIGVCVAGRARAYEIAAFSGKPGSHVVNDVLAGRAVTVVYCDFTRCTRLFTSTTSGAAFDIGISGWHANKGLLLYVGGVKYALEDGRNMTQPHGPPLPCQRQEHERTTWGQWRRAHPDTDVYSVADRDSVCEKDHWPGVRQPPIQSVDEADLGDDAGVIGVCVAGRARAYEIASLVGGPEFHVVNDLFSGRPVTVSYCPLTGCVRVFTSKPSSTPLDIGVGGLDDDESMMLYLDGVKYAHEDGKNLTQPKGPRLPYQRMEYELTTWGQWRRAHPDTDVYLLSSL